MQTSRKRGFEQDLEHEEEYQHQEKKTRRLDGNNSNELNLFSSWRIGVSAELWNNLDEEIKEFVKRFNAAVGHGEDTSKIKVPPRVTIKKVGRRTVSKSSTEGTV